MMRQQCYLGAASNVKEWLFSDELEAGPREGGGGGADQRGADQSKETGRTTNKRLVEDQREVDQRKAED